MSGICSIHQHRDPNCSICNAITPEQEEQWAKAAEEYEKAVGTVVCRCGMRYFRNVRRCPSCARPRPVNLADSDEYSRQRT